MPRRGFRFAIFLLSAAALCPAASPGRTRPALIPLPHDAAHSARVQLDHKYGKLPLAFELNAGQTDSQALFLARGQGMTIFFTAREAVMALRKSEKQAVVRMSLAAGKPRRPTGLDKLPGVTNYFLGDDPKKWRTNVPNYARIQYEDVYPGVDLVWYGNQRQLEYDFVVAPGADPEQIQVAYDGVESLRVENGELVLQTALGEVRQQKPRVYQEIGGKRVEVGARYALVARNRVRFELARYDRKRELRIDPVVLVYSTTLRGAASDEAAGIAVDSAGSAYITGETNSAWFPTQSPYQGIHAAGPDAFVTKLTPAGDALVYSTFLGGSGVDRSRGIALDAGGAAYVAGYTSSTDFPTQSANQASYQGDMYDGFVTKLSPAGDALVYSTYLGGGNLDQALAIAVNAAGTAYVTGVTHSPTQFPWKSAYQAFQGQYSDAFVTSFSPTGALVYSTYLGGTGAEYGLAVAVDASGAAYVTGNTTSTDFPTLSPYQGVHRGGTNDCFVTKLSPAGDTLIYSTYLGGNGNEWGRGIAVDQTGSAYVGGETESPDFPMASAHNATLRGYQDGFVTKLTPAGDTLVYSTYLGGTDADSISAIAVDTGGAAYVTGSTGSTDFPVQRPYQGTLQGNTDAFVTKLTAAGDALSFSTYLGASLWEHGVGIAVDAAGSAYVAGFIVPVSAWIPEMEVDTDVFAAKLEIGPAAVITTNPPGLAIAVDGTGQTAPSVFSWIPGSNHILGAVSPQQIGVGARYVFAGWSDGGAQTHLITAPSADTTYTAAFVFQDHLTITVSPPGSGTATVSPASPDGYYNSGATLQLTATPSPGYRFSQWSGDVTAYGNPHSFVMSGTRNVTAVFVDSPLIGAVVDSASGRTAIAPNSFVTIYGANFTTWSGDWSGAIQDGALPTALGGVQVRINGKDAFISYAQPDQLNVLTPPDTASGAVSVEVITATGTATATAVMAPVAPALFGYSLSGQFYAVAQIANTTTLVAPVGAFGETPSRPAQAGDYLSLWALGMGSTDPTAPAGQVLTTAYPIADLSRIQVKFGGQDATVLWAGLVMPGLYQVNVQAPAGLSGEQPVVMTVDGVATQPEAFLVFQ